MNSRALLLSATFLLACIILIGSVAIQLAVGDARPAEPGELVDATVADDPPQPESEEPAPDYRPRPQSVRKLEALLRHADALMAADPSFSPSAAAFGEMRFSDEVVALFGQMVKTIDESEGQRFVIVVGDPNPQTAHERAEMYRTSLMLALEHPHRLKIETTVSSRSQLTVRTLDKYSMP